MSVFHKGEKAIQARAGVADRASHVANGIHQAIPPAAREFLLAQPFAIIGARDEQDRVWASALHGPPGFLNATNDYTLEISSLPLPGDPLQTLLTEADGNVPIGLLVIEPATRRRLRLNGKAKALPDHRGLQVHAEQVYSNCPKYIQKRELVRGEVAPAQILPYSPAEALNASQRRRLEAADTFFIATTARIDGNTGADASHRGGNPGFVHVAEDGKSLGFPDYSGNAMFNTLGNLEADPLVGLLFLDWEDGDIFQITGEARVLWGMEAERAGFAGADRAVLVKVKEVVEQSGAFPLRYDLIEYSRFNPA